MTRSYEGLVSRVARRLGQLPAEPFACVAIDGVDAAGKTTFAAKVVERLRGDGREAVSISIDGFHHKASTRHRRSIEDPAASFYEDSFDYAAFRTEVINPLTIGAPASVSTATHDLVTDASVLGERLVVTDGAVVVVDGIFLGRPELRDVWDAWVYLDVREDVAAARGVERDAEMIGSQEAAARRYADRYVPGQRLYHQESDPLTNADIVIDMTHFDRPAVLRDSLV